MDPVSWVKAHKEDFLDLQRSGISALGAAAQMVHEAFNGDGSMSGLAKKNNFMGLKWPRSGWVKEYGGFPVTMGTWEVLDGERVDLDAAFTAFPDWNSCKEAYRALITSDHYKYALNYTRFPVQYIDQLRMRGYATDPNYTKKVEKWIEILRPIFDEPTWGKEEHDYLVNGVKFLNTPIIDLDSPVTFRWIVTVLARLLSRYILKDGRF